MDARDVACRDDTETPAIVYVFDMDEAMSEWRELMAGLGVEDLDLRRACSKLANIGLPVFRIKRDRELTPVAGRFVVPYQLADELKALLPAARAKNGHLGVCVEKSW